MKKISPKTNSDVLVVSFYSLEHNILRPPSSPYETKDNGIWARAGWTGCPWSTRVPSLKRSVRTWKNFYHLFPEVYAEMIKLHQAGQRLVYRGAALRYIDMTGEFLAADNSVFKHTMFGRIKKNKLNKVKTYSV